MTNSNTAESIEDVANKHKNEINSKYLYSNANRNIELDTISLVEFARFDCYKNGDNGHTIHNNQIETEFESDIEKVKDNNKGSQHTQFFLFDYYDSLIYKDTKHDCPITYRDTFGLGEMVLADYLHLDKNNNVTNNHPKIASQLCTLIKLKEDEINDNPFTCLTEDNASVLSDKPYLGIIRLSINTCHYEGYYEKWKLDHSIEDLSKESLLGLHFIKECMNEIKIRIRKFTNKSKHVIESYISPNYGDICVVIRSKSLCDIYKLVYKIRRVRQDDSEDKNKELTFRSFTTIGMETKLDDEDVPCKIESDDTEVLDGNDTVVVRMSTDYQTMINLKNKLVKRNARIKSESDNIDNSNSHKKHIDQSKRSKNEEIGFECTQKKYDSNQQDILGTPRALVGRYDISMKINFKYFNFLYPAICHAKLSMGDKDKVMARINEADDEFRNDEVLNEVYRYIVENEVNIVNERTLIQLEKLDDANGKVEENNANENEELVKKFVKNVDKLATKIDNLSKKAWNLNYRRNQYIEQMRLIKEIHNTYLPMWNQDDSFINDWFLHSVMTMVMEITDSYLKEIDRRLSNTVQLCTNYCYAQIHEEHVIMHTNKKYRIDINNNRDDRVYIDYIIEERSTCNPTLKTEQSSETINKLDCKNCKNHNLLEKYMKDLQGEDVSLEDLCKNVVKSLKIAVYSINNYAKMIQSVNIRTFHKPNYEIESHINNEKYIMALTQYVINLCGDFYGPKEDSSYSANDRPYKTLMPLIYLDFLADGIEMKGIFHTIKLCGYKAYNINDISNEDSKNKSKTLNDISSDTSRFFTMFPISIPSYEGLAKLYDLIPKLLHEVSHTYGYQSRSSRNEDILKLVCKRLSRHIAHKWIRVNNDLSSQSLLIEPINHLTDYIFKAIYTTELMALCSDIPLSLVEYRLNEYFINNFFWQYSNHDNSPSKVDAKNVFINAIKNLYNQSLTTKKIKYREDQQNEANSTISFFNDLIVKVNELENVKKADSINSKGKLYQSKTYISKILINNNKFVEKMIYNLGRIGVFNTIQNMFERLDEYSEKIQIANLDSVSRHEFDEKRKYVMDNKGKDYEKPTGVIMDRFLGYKKKVSGIQGYIIYDTNFERYVLEKCNNTKLEKDFNDLCKDIETLCGDNKEVKDAFRHFENSNRTIISDVKNGIQNIVSILFNVQMAINAFINENGYIIIDSQETKRAEFVNKLSEIISENGEENDNEILINSHMVSAMYRSLNIKVQNKSEMKKTIHKALDSIATVEASSIIGDSIDMYREVKTDLSMCKMLGLNPYGYYHTMLKMHKRQDFTHNENAAHAFYIERMAYVLMTIMANDKDYTYKKIGNKIYLKSFAEYEVIINRNFDCFLENIKDFVINTFGYVITNMEVTKLFKSKKDESKEHNILSETMCQLIDEIESYKSVNDKKVFAVASDKMETSYGIVKNAFNYGEKDGESKDEMVNLKIKAINKYVSKIQFAIDMVNELKGVQRTKDHILNNIENSSIALNIYLDLYKSKMSDSEDNSSPNSYAIYDKNFGGIRSKVGEFTNDTNPYCIDNKEGYDSSFTRQFGRDDKEYDKTYYYQNSIYTPELMLKNTYEFIIHQYYYNRIRMCSNTEFGVNKIFSMYSSLKKEVRE